MSCAECAELRTHAFKAHADLVHAVQTAAQEMERGVLERVAAPRRSVAEERAVYSAMDAGEHPVTIDYAFRCTVCGDRFTLVADTASGEGRWIRNDEEA